MSYSDALTYLYSIAPPFHEVGTTAYKPGLDTMRRLMAALHPQSSTLNCPVIHVAGTNGKGSTSHLIASALAASGLKVGLYTSPHLVSFCERVRVIEQANSTHQTSNITPHLISEDYVARFVEEHQSLFAQLQPSFFEITTALAFCWLSEQQVDIAVIEVGLGGLLDATNIVTPVLSVITNIGMDHTDLLGRTLARIATQKAGIIKPGVPCVIGETHPETAPVFLSKAAECSILGDGLETTDCRLWFADQCEFLRRQRLRLAPDCELHGDYQQRNLQTAYVALMALSQLSTLNAQRAPLHSSIRDGFAHVVTYTGLRGRWETLAARPLTICDTGHNSHGIATYVEQLRRIGKPMHIVFGMVADKDIDHVLPLLPAEAAYYFTQPASHRALPAGQLLAKWQALHPASRAQAFSSIDEALACAQAAAYPDDLIFIGGSNYVVGEVIKMYDNIKQNKRS